MVLKGASSTLDMKLTLQDRFLYRELGLNPRYTSVKGLYGQRVWIEDIDIVNELGGHSGCVNALRQVYLCWQNSSLGVTYADTNCLAGPNLAGSLHLALTINISTSTPINLIPRLYPLYSPRLWQRDTQRIYSLLNSCPTRMIKRL